MKVKGERMLVTSECFVNACGVMVTGHATWLHVLVKVQFELLFYICSAK